jgi:AcrR family transcriptional regulator
MATQAERSEASRKAIVAAAVSLFGEKGFAATSIDAVAAAAGLAKGAVYHHFATKQALFDAVLQQASAALAVEIAAKVAESPDVLLMLARGTQAYFDACARPPYGQIILKDGPAVLGWARWRQIDEDHFGRAIPAALGAAMNQGLIAQAPIGPLSRLLMGAVTEAAAACAASADPAATGRAHAAAFEHLIQGLRRHGR